MAGWRSASLCACPVKYLVLPMIFCSLCRTCGTLLLKPSTVSGRGHDRRISVRGAVTSVCLRVHMIDFSDESSDGEVLDSPVKPGSIRIILADSQAIYRVGIRKVFALEDDLRVVAQAILWRIYAMRSSAIQPTLCFSRRVAGRNSQRYPDLLRSAPQTKLIVQAVSADENHTVELYRRGVRGIISRAISPDLLVRCIRRIAAGETWIDNQSVNWVIEAYRAQASALMNPRTQARLSPKEMSIIACITQGKRNKEIAHQMGTTEQVIKNYLRKIYDKLGVSDRLELALYCLHNKITQTDADEVLTN